MPVLRPPAPLPCNQSGQPVLVDYWATWCGPCKLVAPLMDWVEKEYPDLKVVKIETDPNPALVEKYKVGTSRPRKANPDHPHGPDTLMPSAVVRRSSRCS